MPIPFCSQISLLFSLWFMLLFDWLIDNMNWLHRDLFLRNALKKKMSSYVGVVVSDPELHSQFTQVELRTLKSKVHFQHHIFFMSKVSNVYLGALYSLIQIKRSWIASPLEIYLLFSPSSTLLVAPLMPMRSNLFWTSLIPMLIKKSISRLSSGWFLSSFLLICFFF